MLARPDRVPHRPNPPSPREDDASSPDGLLSSLALAAGPVLALLALTASPTAAQEADTAGGEAAGEGPERIGAFVHVRQGDGLLLVTPDTASTLNRGARLFLRCRGGERSVFVALAAEEGGLGNQEEGAAGQFRIDRGPWTDLEQWGANAAGTAAFMNPERVPTFVGRAVDGDLAEIRIVNPAGVRQKFVFPMEGMEEALARLPCIGD